MARKRRVSENARATTVYLTPADELILSLIGLRRRARGEGKDSPSEVVADALRKYLSDTEGVAPEQISALIPEVKTPTDDSNLKQFPAQPKSKN